MVLVRKRHSPDGLLKVTGRDVPEAEYALNVLDRRWTLDGTDLTDAAATARRREESTSLGDRSTEIIKFVADHPDGVAAKVDRDQFGTGTDTYLQRLTKSERLAKLGRGLYIVPNTNSSPHI